jgi:peptidoglycan hydrolase CwlO-like protein
MLHLAFTDLDMQIAELNETRAQLAALINERPTVHAVGAAATRKRRTLSAAARAKISAAAKARWAKEKKAKAKARRPKPATARRSLTSDSKMQNNCKITAN